MVALSGESTDGGIEMGGGMKADNLEALYEDEEYFVLSIDAPGGQVIELGFLSRGMNLNFSYDQWTGLKRIVAGIEIPESLSEQPVVLYEDDSYSFVAGGEVIHWVIEGRRIIVLWDYEGWRRLRELLPKVKDPVSWTMI